MGTGDRCVLALGVWGKAEERCGGVHAAWPAGAWEFEDECFSQLLSLCKTDGDTK